VPLPLTVLLCVAPGEVTFNFAQMKPVAVGVKTTLIVHEDPTGTGVEQLLVCENWLGALPVSVMLVMGSGALPMFVTVIGCGALEVPLATLPNDTLVGDTVNGSLPVPDTVAVRVTPDAVTLNVAFMVPAAVGVNTTWIVQLDPAGTVLPQVLVCENWLAPVPVKPIAGWVSGPLLLDTVTVTACAALEVPT
jgi:hypothetical protein